MLTLCYDFSGIGSSKPPANPMKKNPLCAHRAGEEPRHSTRKSTGPAVLKASGVGDPASPGSVLLLWLPLQRLPLPSAPATRAILPPPHSCVYPSRSSTFTHPSPPPGTHLGLLLPFTACSPKGHLLIVTFLAQSPPLPQPSSQAERRFLSFFGTSILELIFTVS